MPNEKRKKLYNYLSSEGMTDLSYDKFSSEYSTNKEKQNKLYSYLSSEGMTDLDESSFSKDYFESKEVDSMGKPEGSQEPLEQSEGTTTTSSSETPSPTQEQSGEGIDLDYFLSQAPKATESEKPRYNETSDYDEYLAIESDLGQKIENKNMLEQASKSRAYGDDPNMMANYDPMTSLNDQKDAATSEVEATAKKLEEKVNKIINPQLASAKSRIYDTDGKVREEYLSENYYGLRVPNLDKINEEADKYFDDKDAGLKAKFKKSLEDEMQFSIDIPTKKLDKKVEENYQKEYGKSLEGEIGAEYQSEFKTKYGKTLVGLAAKNKSEIDSVNTEYTKVLNDFAKKGQFEVDGLSNSYKESALSLQAEYEQLVANNIPFDQKEYTKKQENLYNQYVSSVDEIVSEQSKLQNEYGAKINRLAAEKNKAYNELATKFSNELSEKYKVSKDIQGKIESVTKKSVKELYDESNKNKEGLISLGSIARLDPLKERYVTSTLSSFGSLMQGWSTSFGGDGEWGEKMEQYFQPNVSSIQSFKDLSLYSVVESSGNLTGSMLPAIATGIATGVATRNASMATRIIATGLSGLATETVDMAGRSYKSALERTGSKEQAKNAASETIDGQIALAPLYMFEGLPFVGAFKKISNPVLRISTGGAVEYASELMQEYPQGLMEKSIEKTGDYEGFIDYASTESFVETGLNMLPVALLGMGGAINKEQNTIASNPDIAMQQIGRIINKKGKDLAKLEISQLYENGNIDESTLEFLGQEIDNYNTDNSEEYNAIKFKRDQVARAAEREEDPVKKKVLNDSVKAFDVMLESSIKGETLNLGEVQIGKEGYIVVPSNPIAYNEGRANTETNGKETTEQPTADMQEGKRDSEEVQQEEDIEELRRAELEPIELAIAKSNETGEVPTVNGNLVGKDDINRINEKYDAKIAELKSKQGGKEVQQKDTKELEDRWTELESDLSSPERKKEFNEVEKELEKREWESIMNSNNPLKSLEELLKKEFKFAEESEIRAAINALDIVDMDDSELTKAATKALLNGDPTKDLGDGILLKVAINEANKRGIPLDKLFSGYVSQFIKDGYSKEKANEMLASALEPILKGATKQDASKALPPKVETKKTPVKEKASKPKVEVKEAELRKARKKELRNKFFNTLNDASRIPTLLADPEFYEYAGMVLEDAVGDFKKFSKEMIKVLGKDIEPELKNIYDKVSLESNKNIDEEGTQSKEQNKDSQKSDGKKGKLRGFAESVLGDKRVKSLSKLRENIKQNPENYYDPQTWAEIQENLDNLSEDELIESMNQTGINIVSDGNNNNAVLAAVEVINRRLAEGKPIDDIVERFAKEGTRMGQLIAQFATLKNSTPAGIMMTLEKFAEKEGKAFTKKQKADLTKLAESMLKSNNKLDAFIKDKGGNATKEDIKTLNELKKQAEKDTKKFYDKSSGFIPMSWSDMTKMTLQGNLLTPMSQATNIVANIAQQGLMIPVDIVSNMSDLVQSIFTGKRTGSLDPMKYVAGWIGAAKGLKEAWGILLKGDSSYAKGEVKKSFRPLTAFTQAISDTKLGDAFGIESGLLPKTLSKKGIELMKESKRALMDGDLEKSSELRDRALSESGIDRNDRLKKIYESFFGAAPEVMFRLLALGDKPFYYFTQYKQLYTQGKRKGLSGQQLRNFVMLPDAKTLEDVNESAAEAVFMEEGLLSKTAIDITNFIEKKAKSVPRIGGALSFLFRTTIPYVKTPSNIISQTIDFVLPPVALGKAVHAYSKGDVKQGNKNIGIFTTGIIMSQVAGMLIAEGLISSPFDFGDDPEDEQNIKRAVGFPPDHLNLSGLKRLLNGKGTELQEGDEVINLKKLGILGAIILIRSSQSEDTYKAEKSKYVNIKDDLGFWDKVSKEGGKYINLGAVPATTKYATEQSFLAGTASLLDAITGGDYETKRWVKQTLGAVSVIGAPNTFSAIDRATETYLHDMRSDNTHSMLESLIVSKIYPPKKIVGIDIYKDFPVRVDMWGEKIKRTPDGKNPLFHQLFDVSKSQTVPHDEKSLEIYNVYRQTLNTKVVPNLPSRIISYNGKKYKVLKDKEHNTLYNEYAAVLGKSRAKMMDKLMSKSSYKESNIERKSELIEKYLSIADKNRDVIKAKRALVDGLDKLAE